MHLKPKSDKLTTKMKDMNVKEINNSKPKSIF